MLIEKENYKYSGILKADTIKQPEMKDKKSEKSTLDEHKSFLKPISSA